jgi:phospholipid N-methyltransferase
VTTHENKGRNALRKLGDQIERRVKDGLRKLERKEPLEPKKSRRPALHYLKAFLKDERVATVQPSTRFVIKRVLRGLALHDVESAVEYGPADGVITARMLEHMPPHSTLIAVERNLDFFNELKSHVRDPRLRAVNGDVRDVEKIIRDHGFEHVDRIVSGIPFSFLTAAGRDALLASTARSLKPGGRFVAYQFTTHLIPLLKRHFDKVDVGFEIVNLPPVFVFTCTKK